MTVQSNVGKMNSQNYVCNVKKCGNIKNASGNSYQVVYSFYCLYTLKFELIEKEYIREQKAAQEEYEVSV